MGNKIQLPIKTKIAAIFVMLLGLYHVVYFTITYGYYEYTIISSDFLIFSLLFVFLYFVAPYLLIRGGKIVWTIFSIGLFILMLYFAVVFLGGCGLNFPFISDYEAKRRLFCSMRKLFDAFIYILTFILSISDRKNYFAAVEEAEREIR